MSYNTHCLDIHGYDSNSAIALVDSFINSHYKAGYTEVSVIHGKGENILKDSLHSYLKSKKVEVQSFKLNVNNIGETLIYLNEMK